jgi:hypothetical protein
MGGEDDEAILRSDKAACPTLNPLIVNVATPSQIMVVISVSTLGGIAIGPEVPAVFTEFIFIAERLLLR